MKGKPNAGPLLFESLKEEDKPHRSLLDTAKVERDEKFQERCAVTARRFEALRTKVESMVAQRSPCASNIFFDTISVLHGSGKFRKERYEYTRENVQGMLVYLHMMGKILRFGDSWGVAPRDFHRKLDHSLSIHGITELADYDGNEKVCGCPNHQTHDSVYHLHKWLKGQFVKSTSKAGIDKVWEFMHSYPIPPMHKEEMRRMYVWVKIQFQKYTISREY